MLIGLDGKGFFGRVVSGVVLKLLVVLAWVFALFNCCMGALGGGR